MTGSALASPAPPWRVRLVPRLAVGAAKEFRALLPVWVASAAAMILATSQHVAFGGLLAYVAGAASLGALSIGQEYGHRTLGILLAQPVSRPRLLIVKIGVLAALLIALFAVAAIVVDAGDIFRAFRQPVPSRAFALFVLFLPVLCGLCLAPWLTMICRSPLAGFVFTLALPASMSIAGALVGTRKYGPTTSVLPLIDALSFAALWQGTLALAAVAGVFGWRTFMRLEAADGTGRALAWPRWRATRSAIGPARRHHPVWLLVMKELRLQQLTLVVAAFALGYWLMVVAVRLILPQFLAPSLLPAAMLAGGLIAVLAGSLASAEERQAGTLEWQTLLPIATSTQWAIKAGLVFLLAAGLAVGLPEGLMVLHPTEDMRLAMAPSLLEAIAGVVMVTATSLYVSSLAPSGIRAVMVSLPAVAAGVFAIQIIEPIRRVVFTRTGGLTLSLEVYRSWRPEDRASNFLRLRHAHMLDITLVLIVIAAVFALMLWFGLQNHRSAERGARRVLVQLGWLASALAGGAALAGAISAAVYH